MVEAILRGIGIVVVAGVGFGFGLGAPPAIPDGRGFTLGREDVAVIGAGFPEGLGGVGGTVVRGVDGLATGVAAGAAGGRTTGVAAGVGAGATGCVVVALGADDDAVVALRAVKGTATADRAEDDDAVETTGADTGAGVGAGALGVGAGRFAAKKGTWLTSGWIPQSPTLLRVGCVYRFGQGLVES